MIVEIIDAELAEEAHLNAAIKVAVCHGGGRIYVSPRVPADAPPYKNPGWIEYLVQTPFMTIGVIQRQPGMLIECHS